MQHQAMPNRRPWIPLLALLLGLIALPGTSQAENQGLLVGAFITYGGATDADPDSKLDETGFQLLFSYERDIDQRFSVRLGQMSLDSDVGGPLFDADLTYIALSGEYMLSAGHYESGLFLGLGAYSIDGDFLVPDEDALGLHLGASGDFRLTNHFSVLADFSVHYADLDFAHFFVMANLGVGFKF